MLVRIFIVFYLFVNVLNVSAQQVDQSINSANKPPKETLYKLLNEKKYENVKEKINDYRMLGEYYMFKSKDSLNYFFSKAIKLSLETKDSFNLMRFYNRLSRNEIYFENDLKAIAYADSSLIYGNRNNIVHYPGIAFSYKLKAESNYYLEKYDVALGQLLEANLFLLKDDQNDETKSYLAENYNDLYQIYIVVDNKLLAKRCLDKSLVIAKSINSTTKIADAYDSFSDFYEKDENYVFAKKYLDSSLVAYEKSEDQNAINLIKKRKAEVLLKEGKIEDAIQIYKTQLPIDERENEPYVLTEDYTFLSQAYIEKGDFTLAKTYLDKARLAAEKSEVSLHDIDIARYSSMIYHKQGNNTAAINELKNILEFQDINYYRESKKDIYGELYSLYEKTNRPAMAYTYLKKYNALKDSLRLELAENKFNVLQTEVDYNEVISDLESKETALKISEEEQKRIKQRDYFIILGISVIALFILISFIKQRKLSKTKREALKAKQEALRLKKEALDAEVRFKNQQITDFAIHISEKNELLEKIKAKLKSVKVINDSHKETVNDTIHFINNDIETDKEKIQLYQQVDETNDSFRAKIDRLYTSLNEKEKKVATMLRLGQTSKQIALQLGISSASVDNYRYNLRKKMEIPKGESLKNFIQNI